MLLYLDDRFENHRPGKGHPERPERIANINRRLRETGFAARCVQPKWIAADKQTLRRVHADAYLQQIEAVCAQGGGQLEADTWASQESWPVASYAAGAAIDAVDRVLKQEAKRAFCAIRPPGHHALVAEPMGFCLLNNIAIAARHAVAAHQLDRVTIIDFDVHHGNGTQDIFYEDGRVAFFSMHRFPFYPGTGAEQETGSGRGLGLIKNVPLPFGTSRKVIIESFTRGIHDLLQKSQPQLILISAGFDAHREDPVGSLSLEAEDYASLTQVIVQAAESYCDGKIVSLLEGGYHLERLPDCVMQHLENLV